MSSSEHECARKQHEFCQSTVSPVLTQVNQPMSPLLMDLHSNSDVNYDLMDGRSISPSPSRKISSHRATEPYGKHLEGCEAGLTERLESLKKLIIDLDGFNRNALEQLASARQQCVSAVIAHFDALIASASDHHLKLRAQYDALLFDANIKLGAIRAASVMIQSRPESSSSFESILSSTTQAPVEDALEDLEITNHIKEGWALKAGMESFQQALGSCFQFGASSSHCPSEIESLRSSLHTTELLARNAEGKLGEIEQLTLQLCEDGLQSSSMPFSRLSIVSSLTKVLYYKSRVALCYSTAVSEFVKGFISLPELTEVVVISIPLLFDIVIAHPNAIEMLTSMLDTLRSICDVCAGLSQQGLFAKKVLAVGGIGKLLAIVKRHPHEALLCEQVCAMIGSINNSISGENSASSAMVEQLMGASCDFCDISPALVELFHPFCQRLHNTMKHWSDSRIVCPFCNVSL